jgi:uncharacterized protein DUF1566/exosortase sorting signal-containing protein
VGFADGSGDYQITLTDGGFGDADCQANGLIVDPMGAGSNPADIPTLAEWALILLMLLMAAYAVWHLRKNPVMQRMAMGLFVVSFGGVVIAGIATSPLGVASHEPASEVGGQTMRSPLYPDTGVSATSITAQIQDDASAAPTGVSLHYRKAGGTWATVAGTAAAGLCADCYAADLPLGAFAEGDAIEYYLAVDTTAGPTSYLYDGAQDMCQGVDCGANGTCLDGACVCDTPYHGADCTALCDDGIENGDEEGLDCGGSCAEGCYAATWTDPATGLVWQKEAGFYGYNDFTRPQNFCAAGGNGLPGTGWRLPNITELRSLIRGCPGTEAGGACGVTPGCTSSACNVYEDCGCAWGEGPVDGGYLDENLNPLNDGFWSDTTHPTQYWDWVVDYRSGTVHIKVQGVMAGVRCVRTGP